MEEVDATLLDGDKVIVSGIAVLLDLPEAPADSADAAEWHAHAALPLGLTLLPGEPMRLETTDGRSGSIVILDPPTVEGDRELYVFTGMGPLERTV
jgi:hypothetical protein